MVPSWILALTYLDFDLLADLVGRHPLALDGDHPLVAPPARGGRGLAPRAAAAPASRLRGLARADHGRGGDGRDGGDALRRTRGRATYRLCVPSIREIHYICL